MTEAAAHFSETELRSVFCLCGGALMITRRQDAHGGAGRPHTNIQCIGECTNCRKETDILAVLRRNRERFG